MSYGKDKTKISIKGGDNAQLKIASSWEKLGHVISGEPVDNTEQVDITFEDLESMKLDGKREVSYEMIVAQSSKDELELIDVVRGQHLPLYIYNNIVGGKWQEFYFPEARLIGSLQLKSGGGEHKTVLYNFSIIPQDGNASVTPDTDLPSDKKATGASPVEGKNPYYVILETAVV